MATSCLNKLWIRVKRKTKRTPRAHWNNLTQCTRRTGKVWLRAVHSTWSSDFTPSTPRTFLPPPSTTHWCDNSHGSRVWCHTPVTAAGTSPPPGSSGSSAGLHSSFPESPSQLQWCSCHGSQGPTNSKGKRNYHAKLCILLFWTISAIHLCWGKINVNVYAKNQKYCWIFFSDFTLNLSKYFILSPCLLSSFIESSDGLGWKGP